MDWLIDLLKPHSVSLASTILLYSFVIFAGIYLGKIKIFGVSLGVTFVLFVGLLMGHFGYIVQNDTLHFLREFGLILFIFSIGMQVGPGFFSSFKEGGLRLNALALTGIGLNVVVMLAIYFIQGGSDGSTSIHEMVGIMSGAVTNTPGLGAAQQTVLQVNEEAYGASQQMSMGYAAAYPLGVVGIILTMILIKILSRSMSTRKSQKSRMIRKPRLWLPTASPIVSPTNSCRGSTYVSFTPSSQPTSCSRALSALTAAP